MNNKELINLLMDYPMDAQIVFESKKDGSTEPTHFGGMPEVRLVGNTHKLLVLNTDHQHIHSTIRTIKY